MASIRASCPTCGDVELKSRDVQVRTCASNGRNTYVFRCPQCALAVSKPADPKIVDLLVSNGVRLTVWQLPAELAEQKDGDIINVDDAIVLHEALQDDEEIARQLASLSG